MRGHSSRRPRHFDGTDGTDILIGTRRDDVIDGGTGDDVIVGGRGADSLSGGAGADLFRFDDRDAGDASSERADVILDLDGDDLIDLSDVNALYFAGFDQPAPPRGGLSLWSVGDSAYLSWNSFGEMHDVEIRGYTGDLGALLRQVRWRGDDVGGTPAWAGEIVSGQTIDARIDSPLDEDWFRIDVAAGTLLTFQMRGAESGEGTLVEPVLFLRDAEGAELSMGYPGEGGAGIRYYAPDAATYYVCADSFDRIGTYALTATAEALADDYRSDAATTGEIAAGESRTGALEWEGDADWFRFDVATDALRMSFALNGDTPGGRALTVYDADRNWYAGNWSDGEDLTLDVFDLGPGTYYVAVENAGAAAGSYALSTTVTPIVDLIGDTPETAGAIAVGETLAGTIDRPYDSDWYAVELSADETYRIEVRGATSESGTLPNPALILLDADLQWVAWNDDYVDADSLIDYTPERSGTYFVLAESWYGELGSYEVSVAPLAEADLLIAA